MTSDDAVYTQQLLLDHPGMTAHLQRTWRRAPEPLPPEVELGVARENLARAHALGTDDDIKNATVAVESAKQRVGREVAARHGLNGPA